MQRNSRVLEGIVFVLLSLLAAAGGTALAKDEPAAVRPRPGTDIVLQGKLFYPLKRQAILPFKGIITSIQANGGQRVKKGDVLATYRVPSETLLQLRRRLCPPQIGELEAQLTDAEKGLVTLHSRQAELKKLVKGQMAPAEALRQVEREAQVLERRRSVLKERIGLEKEFAKDDLEVLKESLGKSLNPSNIPAEVSLTAQIDGYITWLNPELHDGAEFPPATPLFAVAVMDPLRIRSSAHEMEAMQISSGDKAEVTFESIPGKVDATVRRVSLTPVTMGLDQPTYYEVELELPNPGLRLREGLVGRISIKKSK